MKDFNYDGPTFSATLRSDFFLPDHLLFSRRVSDNGRMADSGRRRQSAGV